MSLNQLQPRNWKERGDDHFSLKSEEGNKISLLSLKGRFLYSHSKLPPLGGEETLETRKGKRCGRVWKVLVRGGWGCQPLRQMSEKEKKNLRPARIRCLAAHHYVKSHEPHPSRSEEVCFLRLGGREKSAHNYLSQQQLRRVARRRH